MDLLFPDLFLPLRISPYPLFLCHWNWVKRYNIIELHILVVYVKSHSSYIETHILFLPVRSNNYDSSQHCSMLPDNFCKSSCIDTFDTWDILWRKISTNWEYDSAIMKWYCSNLHSFMKWIYLTCSHSHWCKERRLFQWLGLSQSSPTTSPAAQILFDSKYLKT